MATPPENANSMEEQINLFLSNKKHGWKWIQLRLYHICLFLFWTRWNSITMCFTLRHCFRNEQQILIDWNFIQYQLILYASRTTANNLIRRLYSNHSQVTLSMISIHYHQLLVIVTLVLSSDIDFFRIDTLISLPDGRQMVVFVNIHATRRFRYFFAMIHFCCVISDVCVACVLTRVCFWYVLIDCLSVCILRLSVRIGDTGLRSTEYINIVWIWYISILR